MRNIALRFKPRANAQEGRKAFSYQPAGSWDVTVRECLKNQQEPCPPHPAT
jgi:hypothetical protein